MPKTVETCIYHGRCALKNIIFALLPAFAPFKPQDFNFKYKLPLLSVIF